jgi:hypothetical protein
LTICPGNAIPAGEIRFALRLDATPDSRFGSIAAQQRPIAVGDQRGKAGRALWI